MAHKLISDEMVVKARKAGAAGCPICDSTPCKEHIRAALEAVADDIWNAARDAFAKELDECAKRGAYAGGPSAVVRRLKSQGQ